jgi:phytoene dehydrogenase-like protein
MGPWKTWRSDEPQRYAREKQGFADLFVDIAEAYAVPNLRRHVRFIDVSTPATYSRYSGSPTGAIYDMASTVDQFGPKRLGLRTPVDNLVQTKFAHGFYGAAMGAVQVVDILTGGSLNGGRSAFSPSL